MRRTKTRLRTQTRGRGLWLLCLPLLCLLLVGWGNGAQAATLYSSNFDSATVGTTPTAWVTPVGSDRVTTTGAVSAPNAFGGGANAAVAVYTGIAAQANLCEQFDEQVVINGTAISSQEIPALRMNSAGTTFYEPSYNLQTRNVQWYAVGPGLGGGAGYVAVGSSFTMPTYTNGQKITVKADVSGSVLSIKFWVAGTAEPGSWTNQTTDTNNYITGTGYAGLYANTNTTPLPAADNLYIGDAGSIFATPLVAGAATLTALTGMSLTFTLTAPTGGTAPYTYAVYRSLVQGTQGSLVASNVTSPWTDTGLTTGQEYAYTVVATDSTSATVTYSQTFGTPSPLKLLVVDGCSLAHGYDNQDGLTLAQQIQSRLGLGWTVVDEAVSGTDIQDAITRYSASVAPLYSLATYPGGCYIAFWELTNQITTGVGPTATLGYLQSYVQMAHATGYKVVVGDVIARSQTGLYAQFETDRTVVNTTLRKTWQTTIGADSFADIAADSRLGPWGASMNSAYFWMGTGGDSQVHLISYAIPADYFTSAITRAVNPSTVRPKGSRPAPKGGH